MTAAPAPAENAFLTRRAMWAVIFIFFLSGFTFANLASRLPAVRDGLGASPLAMGTIMLFSSLGSIIAMPFAGSLAARVGTRRMIRVFSSCALIGLMTIGLAVYLGSRPVACVALLLYGLGFGSWDVSMNLEGTAVERNLRRAIMPRFHGGYSLGSVAGAGLAALATSLRVPFWWHMIAVCLLASVIIMWATTRLLPDRLSHIRLAPAAKVGTRTQRMSQAVAAWREPRTLLIGLVVLAVALTEGAGNDWVSLAVTDGFDTPPEMGPIGLGVFLGAMTIMRLCGTGLLDRFGRVTVLRVCSVLSAAGLVIFVTVDSLPLALVGVAVWGLGAALGFPVGMSAASDDPAKAAKRLSVVSTIGYTAFLAGPPLIGLLAENLGYRHALAVILVPIIIGFAATAVVAPPKHDPEALLAGDQQRPVS